MKIIWSPLAWAQVEESAAFIFGGDSDGALNWINRLLDDVEQLERFPEMGRMVPEVGRPNIRELIWRKYRVIYRLDPNRINILLFQHGKRPLDPEGLENA